MLSGLFGKRRRTAPPAHGGRLFHARFDAAQTSADNARHWSAAEFLSADAEASPEVRRTLRARARYEEANNSYAFGIVDTLANDSVGTGPRLQMTTEKDAFNEKVEHDFRNWARAIGLAEKLRTIRKARCRDGEAFAILARNPALEGVQLDLQLVEADRVTDDDFQNRPDRVDGISYDAYGNPTSYKVLRQHPGGAFGASREFMVVPAKWMIHAFRADRPEQHRGIPELTPALPLFAQLRRYTLAVLSAAEAAADFSGILYTDHPASGESDSVTPMDTIQLERNMLLTMPDGWKMDQLDPKQPASSYGEFKKEILNEIARCLNIPYNVAAGNSSGYNYASGRLDHQTYFKAIRIEQAFTERVVLDRVFGAWYREWALANAESTDLCDCAHVWFWDGTEHVDPLKEASAQTQRLTSLTTTLAAEYARQGRDWETELRQIAKERALLKTLGLPDPGPPGQQPKEEETDGDT